MMAPIPEDVKKREAAAAEAARETNRKILEGKLREGEHAAADIVGAMKQALNFNNPLPEPSEGARIFSRQLRQVRINAMSEALVAKGYTAQKRLALSADEIKEINAEADAAIAARLPVITHVQTEEGQSIQLNDAMKKEAVQLEGRIGAAIASTTVIIEKSRRLEKAPPMQGAMPLPPRGHAAFPANVNPARPPGMLAAAVAPQQ